MIDSEDIDAVERYITDWHVRRADVRFPNELDFELELAEEHTVHVTWFRMWARKAGLLNERASESVRTQ